MTMKTDQQALQEQILEAIQRQNELLQRLVQIQESMLILVADEHDACDVEPQTYLSGKPAT